MHSLGYKGPASFDTCDSDTFDNCDIFNTRDTQERSESTRDNIVEMKRQLFLLL